MLMSDVLEPPPSQTLEGGLTSVPFSRPVACGSGEVPLAHGSHM